MFYVPLHHMNSGNQLPRMPSFQWCPLQAFWYSHHCLFPFHLMPELIWVTTANRKGKRMSLPKLHYERSQLLAWVSTLCLALKYFPLDKVLNSLAKVIEEMQTVNNFMCDFRSKFSSSGWVLRCLQQHPQPHSSPDWLQLYDRLWVKASS